MSFNRVFLRETTSRQNTLLRSHRVVNQHARPLIVAIFGKRAHREFKMVTGRLAIGCHVSVLQELVGERGKQQWRRFPGNTRNSQQDTGHNAGDRGFQRNREIIFHFGVPSMLCHAGYPAPIYMFSVVRITTSYPQQRQRNHPCPAGEVLHLRHHDGVKQTAPQQLTARGKQNVVNKGMISASRDLYHTPPDRSQSPAAYPIR